MVHINLVVFVAKQSVEVTRIFIERDEDRVQKTSMDAEQVSQEPHHPTLGGEGRARMQYVQLAKGYTPIITYPSNLPEELPCKSGLQQTTLESCRAHYDKLQRDLSSLDLTPENKQSIEMVLKSLQKFIEVYEDLGTTTNGFVELMQRRKEHVMGPYKWVVVKERVTRE